MRTSTETNAYLSETQSKRILTKEVMAKMAILVSRDPGFQARMKSLPR